LVVFFEVVVQQVILKSWHEQLCVEFKEIEVIYSALNHSIQLIIELLAQAFDVTFFVH